MRVLTLQGYDLREFRGPIELNRSTYNDCKNIIAAKKRLYDLIDEDQVVWCGQDEPCLHGETGRYIHDIDADRRDIAAIVDALVWCHIIGYNRCYIPPEEHGDLRFRAATSACNYDAELRQAEDDYLAANLPDDLWPSVIKLEVSKKSDQVLLKFPFAYSVITNVEVVSTDMANKGHRTRRLEKTASRSQKKTMGYR